MRILILTDIHANLNALKAVFARLDELRPDIIISLGDQVNYGPYPKETLALLRDKQVFMLMGNHEERLLRLRVDGESTFDTYNWSLMHFTFNALKGETFLYPRELRFGRYFFTHNMPGDLFKELDPADTEEFTAIAKALPQGVDRYFSGHVHVSWQIQSHGITFRNSGSTGCYDGARGLLAGWHFIDDNGLVETHQTPYDPTGLKQAFISSSAARMAPEFARLVMHQIETGEHKSFRKFIALAAQTGLEWHTREAFRLAAEEFPWTSSLSTEAYWQKGEA
jgi:Predicted phosphoesterase